MTRYNRHTDFCPRRLVTGLLQGSNGKTGVMDFEKTCYGEVDSLLWTCCGEGANLL